MEQANQEIPSNYSRKEFWLVSLYNKIPLIRLCANTLGAALIIEITLTLLKLILAASGFVNSFFIQSSSTSEYIFGFSIEELVRLIDHVAFVFMFSVNTLFEIIKYCIESYKSLNRTPTDARTTS